MLTWSLGTVQSTVQQTFHRTRTDNSYLITAVLLLVIPQRLQASPQHHQRGVDAASLPEPITVVIRTRGTL